MRTDYYLMDWEACEKICQSLAAIIRKDYDPDSIVAISRGGLIPATCLSHLLGDVPIGIVPVKFMLGINKRIKKPKILAPVNRDLSGESVLLVDDISDTGTTAKLVISHLKARSVKSLKFACLSCKPWTKTLPDYYFHETKKWVVYPWEMFPVYADKSVHDFHYLKY